MTFDFIASVQFLQAFHPHSPWVVAAIPPESGRPVVATFGPGLEAQLQGWLHHHSAKGLYFTPGVVSRPMTKKPAAADMAGADWLWVDIDPRPDFNLVEERARILEGLRGYSPPPTVIVDSGRGYWGFWRLAERFVPVNGDWTPFTDRAKALAVALGGDHTHNPDRLARLPGSVNWPNAKKTKQGAKPATASVVAFHKDRHILPAFPKALHGAASRLGGDVAAASARLTVADGSVPPALAQLPVSDATKRLILEGAPQGERSEAVMRVLCACAGAGMDAPTVRAVVTNPSHGISERLLEKGNFDAEWVRAQNYVTANRGAPPGHGPDLDGGLRDGTDVEIADALMAALTAECGAPPVHCDGALHLWAGTHWRALGDADLARWIYPFDRKRFGQQGVVRLGQARTESVASILCNKAHDPEFFANAPRGVNCASGFVAFDRSGAPAIEPHSPDHRQRFCLAGTWRPGATWHNAPLLVRLLHGCFCEDTDAAERVALIGELCGAAALGVATGLRQPRAIVFIGPTANNGKSQVLALLRGLLPADAVRSVPPGKFGDEKHLATLAGAALNACDELGNQNAVASDTFKAVITGDIVTARPPYQKPFSFRPRALHVFATNTLPSFAGGMDRGVRRRLMALEFTRSIPPAEIVEQIGERVAKEEADALLAFAIEGASRLVSAGGFTVPPSCNAALRDWVSLCDPIVAWFEERASIAPDARTLSRAAYDDFRTWAGSNGHTVERLPGIPQFVQRVTALDSRMRAARSAHGRFIHGLKLAAAHGLQLVAGTAVGADTGGAAP